MVLAPALVLKTIIHAIGNGNYGFHRDELLHLSVGEHLSWGYFEFPPMIAILGRLSDILFDQSLFGTRLFPTLAGLGILILTGLMARDLGGRRGAIFLSGAAFLAFVPYFRNHLLFQPVAFDQFFWTLGFFALVRFITTRRHEWLLLLGVAAGFGIMSKYTMLIWGLGAAAALVLHDRGSAYRSRHLYAAGAIMAVIILPNVHWQWSHGWPLLEHMQSLTDKQLSTQGPWDFPLGQLDYPLTLVLSLIGLGWLLRHPDRRPLAAAFIVTFAAFWALGSKDYYFFAAYPVVFAAGSVAVERMVRRRPAVIGLVSAALLLPSIPSIPRAIPILPIHTFTRVMDIPESEGRVRLTSDYADMFGWDEQVAIVDSLYRSLSPEDRAATVIWAENYGEAGAIKVLGDAYDLPDPISRHGSFWFWGHGRPDARVWISIGNEASAVEPVFGDITLIRTVHHRYAIDEEQGIPVYLLREPKVDIPSWWAAYRPHVFD